MIRIIILIVLMLTGTRFAVGQSSVAWQSMNHLFEPLPSSIQVWKTTSPLEGKPNIAWCVIADLQDKHLRFVTDTTMGRRLTPAQFYARNQQPLLVMNGTFFEFVHPRNLNVVIRHGKALSYNLHSIPQRGKDTLTFLHPFRSALGINRKRRADVAWIYTDSASGEVLTSQHPVKPFRDSSAGITLTTVHRKTAAVRFGQSEPVFRPWRVQTAIGGGPVLIQNGQIFITNNEELMFAGSAVNDKHPRTAIGYTSDGKLVMLVVEGRAPGKAEGASLVQLAAMMKELGCVEALNLDGGGSSCLLVNGKETIRPSDKEGQRPVPAVFMIKLKKGNQ